MTYISSAGLRAVLAGATTRRHLGGRLAIAALAPECRSVLEVSGFLSFLDDHETVDAALAAPDRAVPAADRPPVACPDREAGRTARLPHGSPDPREPA